MAFSTDGLCSKFEIVRYDIQCPAHLDAYYCCASCIHPDAEKGNLCEKNDEMCFDHSYCNDLWILQGMISY